MTMLLNIDVPDLAAAEHFYTEAFELRAARRLGAHVLELVGGDVPVYLLRQTAGTAGAGEDSRRYARHWTPLHIDWVVSDLDRALAKALGAGAIQEGPVAAAEWGRIARIADPFGHGWCLLQFVGRGYDMLAVT